MDYSEVESLLREEGFSNIVLSPLETGIDESQDGKCILFSINNQKIFEEKDEFHKEDEVVISYWSVKKNNSMGGFQEIEEKTSEEKEVEELQVQPESQTEEIVVVEAEPEEIIEIVGASLPEVDTVVEVPVIESESVEEAVSTLVQQTNGAYAVNNKNGKVHMVGECNATELGNKNAMEEPVYFNTYEEAEAYSKQTHPEQKKIQCGNCW